MEITDKAIDTENQEQQKDSLTNWTNEPTVVDFKQDIADAKPDADAHISRVNVWLDNLNIKGTAKFPKTKNRSSLVPKVIRKQAEWRYSSLSEPFLSTPDIFNIDPTTFEDKESAIQNELILNNQFNTKIPKIQFIGDYIRTAVDEGSVVVRVGWAFEEDTITQEVPKFIYQESNDPEDAAELQQLVGLAQQDPTGYAATTPEEQQEAVRLSLQAQRVIIAIQDGTEEVTFTNTTKNCPTLEICDYNNISIDPTAKSHIDEASFITYSFETSLSQLEKDGKYTNLNKINVTGSSLLSEPDHHSTTDSTFNFKDKPRSKFVAIEYWGFWDIDGTGIVKPIVATWVGDILIRLEENPFPDKKVPFVVVQYLPVRRSIYGEPDGELLIENQKIIGAVTRGMIDTMGRSANGQMGIRKDALDLTNRRKFDKGLDYEFNAPVDPRQAFYMHTFPEIPQSAQYMLAAQNADAESLTGVKAFSGTSGITGSALGDNVGGIKSALDATAKRELGILRRLTEGLKDIARKIISMNAVFLDEEEVVRVTNKEFITIRRDDLEGNFDLRISISTAEADNAKAEELAFMLQTTGQTMGAAFSQMILSEIARLRKMPVLAREIKEYTPEPDPLAEEKAQLEIELLKAQIAKEYSIVTENQAEANLDNAKAGNVSSDTDQKNLDFVEQETGTKQERDLQKQGEQARSNAQLENVKHINKLRENQLNSQNS